MLSTLISERRSPLKFFLLVFALSTPLWLIGAVNPKQLLPGLPVSSLMAFCPLIASFILISREDKTDLLKRTFDYRRIKAKVWYIPTILLMPGIAVLVYGLMCLLQLPLPTPQLSVLSALVMFLTFFIAALGEELGWTGYAIDPMQDQWTALQSSILLGLVWAIWHIVPFAQAGRSVIWIAWQCFTLVTLRVLLVWIYNNTGKSVFAVVLCHTTINVSWQLFPNYGSHYDPRITGLTTALTAVIVVFVWGPRTLARNKNI